MNVAAQKVTFQYVTLNRFFSHPPEKPHERVMSIERETGEKRKISRLFNPQILHRFMNLVTVLITLQQHHRSRIAIVIMDFSRFTAKSAFPQSKADFVVFHSSSH